MIKLNAKQLRDLEESFEIPEIKRIPFYFILDNIYDTYNIGGLFRLADGLAVERVYLCGSTETPPNHRIKKASVGTYKVVPWTYKKDATDAIDEVRALGAEVISIEQHPTSIPFTKHDYRFPTAFVIGNETDGVSEPAIKASDVVVEIPMTGVNKSLNVIVASAIVGFHALNAIG